MGLSNLFSNALRRVTFIKPDVSFNDVINPAFDPVKNIISVQLICEKKNSEQLAKLPLEIYITNRDQGRQKHKSHYLYRKIHNSPNAWQTQTLFFEQLERWRLHHGDAWAKIHRHKGTGQATHFTHIQPGEIVAYKLEGNNLYWLRVWQEDDQEKREVLHNDEVLHFRFTSDNGVTGLKPTDILFNELDNIYQGQSTLNNIYKNNLNIDKVFETEIKNFKTDLVKETLNELRKDYGGAANSGKVPYLPAGFKLVGVPRGNVQDAQILESLGFSERKVAALYGTPLHLIGMDGQSYNSIEAQTMDFKANVLQPVARMYRQELENKLLTDEEIEAGVSIEFNINAIVEVEMSTRTAYYKALHSMASMTANQVAISEGGETYEGGDMHFIQSQYIPVEQYETYAKAAQNSNLTILPASQQSQEGAEGDEIETPTDVEAEAKAKLKGSVGGVQGILAIQQQVAQGITSYSAGLAILELIYGIGPEEGRRILGDEKKVKKQNKKTDE